MNCSIQVHQGMQTWKTVITANNCLLFYFIIISEITIFLSYKNITVAEEII